LYGRRGQIGNLTSSGDHWHVPRQTDRRTATTRRGSADSVWWQQHHHLKVLCCVCRKGIIVIIIITTFPPSGKESLVLYGRRPRKQGRGRHTRHQHTLLPSFHFPLCPFYLAPFLHFFSTGRTLPSFMLGVRGAMEKRNGADNTVIVDIISLQVGQPKFRSKTRD
jgi:hypothetical protein